METKDVAGLVAGSTDLQGTVVLARRKITISGKLPPNNVITHVGSAGAHRHGNSAAKFSADDRERRQGECVHVQLRGPDDFEEKGRDIGAYSEGHVTGAIIPQHVINIPKMKELKKVWRKKKYKVARPNDKLMVETKNALQEEKKVEQDGEFEKYK